MLSTVYITDFSYFFTKSVHFNELVLKFNLTIFLFVIIFYLAV